MGTSTHFTTVTEIAAEGPQAAAGQYRLYIPGAMDGTTLPASSPSAPANPAQPAPTSTPTPVIPGTSISAKTAPTVYSDALMPGWQDWSWNISRRFAEEGVVYKGIRSIAFAPTDAWGGLYLHTMDPFRGEDALSLCFAAKATSSGQKFGAILFGPTESPLFDPVSINQYGGEPRTDRWQEYRIPFAPMKGVGETITGLAIHDIGQSAQPNLYVDDIRFCRSDVAAPSAPTAVPANPNDPFVRRDGERLMLGGKPFRFVGFNLFDAAGLPNGYHCSWWPAWTDAELDTALKTMQTEAGATVLRFWAFQSYTNGGTDWSGIDRVIRIAKARGIKVMPVIENHWEHCSQGGQKYGWYSKAINADYKYGYALSFKEYTKRLVQRYKDEPAILGWTLVNEAEDEDQESLYVFAKEMSAYVKSLDSTHLVTLGTQSSGPVGVRDEYFTKVYSLNTIDFVEGHDYAWWGGDTLPLPGSFDGTTLPDASTCSDNSIACNLARTRLQLNKPFIVGEVAIQIKTSGKTWTREQRAELYNAKMQASFNAGVDGYLLWQWNKVIDEGYDVLPDDPVIAIMKRALPAS